MKKILIVLSAIYVCGYFVPACSYQPMYRSTSYEESQRNLYEEPTKMLARIDRWYEVQNLSFSYKHHCVPGINRQQKMDCGIAEYLTARDRMLRWGAVYMRALENYNTDVMRTAYYEMRAVARDYFRFVSVLYWEAREIALYCRVDSSSLMRAERKLSWNP